MAVASCTIFLHHHHLLHSDQSVSLQIITYTQNTTGDARLQSVLEWLSYSLQPSTVPVPIRISAQSAPTSRCITCRGTTCLSAVSLLIWNSQDSQAQWSYLSPQHSGACSYVFEASLGHKEMKGSYKHKNTTENWLWTMQGKTSTWHPNLKICHYVYVTTKRKINSNITSKCFAERLANHSVFTLDYLHDRNTILEVAFNFPNTVHSLPSDSYHAFGPKWLTAEETQWQGSLKLGVQNLAGSPRLTCQGETTNPLHHCPGHLSYKP